MNRTATTEPAPAPAPGAEQYVALDFANSVISLPGGQLLDLLGTPETATRWLTERDLTPADTELKETCASRMRSLRDQVRALFAARISRHPAPPEALIAVNEALTRVPTAAPLHWDPTRGLHRTNPHPVDQSVDHALGVLAAGAADLLTGPDAERLTACGSAPCNRYLLRSGRRHWCSVRCGDRARAARAYARRNTG
ncbi:CGNR zinc finger domain-containing protein [Streptomyces cellulosae]|uniref:CGNR zinc finger domain-containing protein n=1 Tax=Streptomyces cellulosae TaxID=1968 RepID=A0ABW7YID3_STRCE